MHIAFLVQFTFCKDIVNEPRDDNPKRAWVHPRFSPRRIEIGNNLNNKKNNLEEVRGLTRPRILSIWFRRWARAS